MKEVAQLERMESALRGGAGGTAGGVGVKDLSQGFPMNRKRKQGAVREKKCWRPQGSSVVSFGGCEGRAEQVKAKGAKEI